MKKIYLLILLLTGFRGYSQEQPKESKTSSAISGGVGYFEMGISPINIKNLNAALALNGFPTFNDYGFTLGGGGHAIIKNIIVGGEGHGINLKERSNSLYETAIQGGYGLFNLGYVIYAKKAWIIYPMLGVGNGSYILRMGENSSASSFNSLLNDPKKQVTLKISGLILSGQLGIERIFGSDNGGSLVGLHVGYNLCPADWGWAWNDSNVFDTPRVNMDGFFVRLSIGGGGYVKR